MNRFMVIPLLLVVSLLTSTISCNKDTEFITKVVQNDVEEPLIDLTNTIVIPKDFDWSAIPDSYANAVWLIAHDFDLSGIEVKLPDQVTLYFSGGSLANGVIHGQQTTLASKIEQPIFNRLALSGTFVENQYLKPYWFGAVMDGVRDDRSAFVETLAQAHAITAKVLIEKDMFLDVEELGKKSIFLENNTWIEGKNDAQIIVNNLLSPAFYMALTKDITIKDVSFLYDNTNDASYDWTLTKDNNTNQQQLENYLSEERAIVFNGTNPVFKGSSSFHTIFSLEAAENIIFDNVAFKAKGTTADTFIKFVFKFKEQYSPNQVVNNEATGITIIPKNITLNNVTFDGTLMGIQGIVNGLKTNGIKSYRYSDLQNKDGSNIGGLVNGVYRFPPPHLFYLNQDSATQHIVENIEILNTLDYGEYVGTPNTRPTISGYCNSLKLTDKLVNVTVKNYQSFRRDGLADIGSVTNGNFEGLYSESNSSIFNSRNRFTSVRFLGILENCTFKDIIIKDLAEKASFYPIDIAQGNSVSMDNIQVFLKELTTNDNTCFGISGNHNKISNTMLNIEKHTILESYRSIIFHNEEVLKNGTNNHYEITVNGWRNIDDDPIKKSIRMLFASSTNTNTNYAKVTDVSNSMVIEQTNATQRNYWTRTEEVVLGSGTSQQLKLNIPAGFRVTNVRAETLEALATGIQVSLGTHSGQRGNLIDNLSKTTGTVAKAINEARAENGTRHVVLYGSGDFNNRGKIQLTLELVRESQYD